MHRGYSEKLSGVGTPPNNQALCYSIYYTISCVYSGFVDFSCFGPPLPIHLKAPAIQNCSYSTVTTTGAQDVAVHLAVVVLHP